MIFKCKYCGANLEITPEASVITCNYCDTPQAIPNLDDEKRANLYDRANHFRRINEYDKASGFYEKLLNEDHTDAEAYWSLALCHYGIEFVNDSKTHRKIPTINRMQYASFLDDANYLSALKYADVSQKMVYEEFGKEINRIQKGILEIAKAEEPFDVFICYKETDDTGRRTQDSVLAQEMYNQLTKEGYKVFFSRITLEDKIGSAYEPYIFAALNSAKVMIVVGTRPEHFNALWVKNEWSRFLYQIKEDSSKVLIPAYKDMDAYDLPEELTYLQALDMSKLGFMQDLIHGISKITNESKHILSTHSTEMLTNTEVINTASLMKRAFIFLEDGLWEKAYEYCERVLDIDPENAQAYLGELMVEMEVRRRENLKECKERFDNKDKFKKAFRFGDTTLQNELTDYINYINDRNMTDVYYKAVDVMSLAKTEKNYKKAAGMFKTILGFKYADNYYRLCLKKEETCRKDTIYKSGISEMHGQEIERYENAINIFQSISGWKDTDEQINICQKRIKEIKLGQSFVTDKVSNSIRKKYAEIYKITFIPNSYIRKNKRTLLSKLLDSFETLTAQKNFLQDEISKLQVKAKQLDEKIDDLGVFSLKEKKETQLNLSITQNKIYRLEDKLTETKELLLGYSSKDKVSNDLARIDRLISEIEEAELFFSQNNDTLFDMEYDLDEVFRQLNKNSKLYDNISIDYPEVINQFKDISLFDPNNKVGSHVFFGNYKCNKLTWTIVKKNDNKMLLFCDFGLDIKPFSKDADDYLWRDSDIRKWLNSSFYDAAFNDIEKNFIQCAEIKTGEKYEVITKDNVFLLSQLEFNEYEKIVNFDMKVFDSNNQVINKSEFEFYLRSYLRRPTVLSSYPRYINPQLAKMGTGSYNLPELSIHYIIGNRKTNTDLTFLESTDALYYGTTKGKYVRPALWIEMNK